MEDELRRRNEELRADEETDPKSTSYALAGTDIRHQRKYRRGSIFKKSRRIAVAWGRGHHIPQAAGPADYVPCPAGQAGRVTTR